MPDQVVFLLHGMGCRDGAWRDSAIAGLKASAAAYPGTSDPGIWKAVAFEDLLYGPILQKVSDDWGQLAKAVVAQAPALEKGSVEHLLGWLAEQRGSFFWTHLVDVVLWRLHPQVRNLVLSSLVSDFAAKAESWLGDRSGMVPAIHLFAHSLGTSVAHELACALATPGPGPSSWAPPRFRWGTVAMFANVAKLLERPGRPVYEGSLRPSSRALDERACHGYLSFEHVLDPFTRPEPFAPPWDDSSFRRIRINHVHQANVHAFDHFLLNPAVHIPVLRTLFGHSAVTQAEELAATLAFPRLPSPGSAQSSAQLEALGAGATDWTVRSRTWLEFLKLG